MPVVGHIGGDRGQMIAGVNHAGLRAHNERLILSLLRRHGALSKAEITRLTGLSAQTISVINRALEDEHFVQRGDPVRGKVGQPSVPMTLDPDGAYSIGLRIGRRKVDLAVMDFVGAIRDQVTLTYPYPTPARILSFVEANLPKLVKSITPVGAEERIVGVGIGAPFQMYNWLDRLGAPQEQMNQWRDFDLTAAVQQLTGLPATLVNDASCACVAEQTIGAGRRLEDFAYFYIGSFIGGGVVMNGMLQTGATGNAGAFGPLPSPTKANENAKLIDTASLFQLERQLKEAGIDGDSIWRDTSDWSRFEPHLSDWLKPTALALANAIVTVCAVIDFPCVVIDGAFPASVRAEMVGEVNRAMQAVNTDGVVVPEIIEGEAGQEARVIGASMLPILAYFDADRPAARHAVAG